MVIPIFDGGHWILGVDTLTPSCKDYPRLEVGRALISIPHGPWAGVTPRTFSPSVLEFSQILAEALQPHISIHKGKPTFMWEKK